MRQFYKFILIGLCFGLVVPVDFYTITLSFPSVIFLMVCWRMPESPVWLMRSGRDVEARQMLQWLRGQGYNIEPEMKELEVIVKQVSRWGEGTCVEGVR